MIRDSRIYQSSISPGQRITYGPFGEVGYIMRNPDYAVIASERRQNERYKNRDLLKTKCENIKALKREKYVKHYQERLECIKIRSAVQHVVELGMKEAELELEQKKNRLRKRMLEDESEYIKEYTNKAQTSLDRRIEGVLKRVEEIEKKNKVSDSTFAQKAYERLAMENDEDFRDNLRLKSSKNLADCIKAQMYEKECAKLQEVNDERLWNTIYDRRVQAERQKIEDAKAAEMQKRQQWAEILDRQIEEEERMNQNQKCLNQLDELRMREYLDKREAEYKMRDQILKDRLVLQSQILERQIEENKQKSKRNQQEGVDLERILIEDERKKVQRAEAAKVDNRAQSRAELGYFKEATEQYRNARAERDAIALHMIEEDSKRIDRKFLLDRKKREIEQMNFARSCAQRSKQMVAEKAAREAEAKEFEARRHHLLNYKNEVNKHLDRESYLHNPRSDHPRTMALQSEHNERYVEILRQRQRLEDQEMLEKIRKTKDQMHGKIREAMAKPLPEIVGTSLHPFYAYISAKNS